jgi:hypothetical protein
MALYKEACELGDELGASDPAKSPPVIVPTGSGSGPIDHRSAMG